MAGRPPRTIGAILHDLNMIPDRSFDPAAERGSAANPAVSVGGVSIGPKAPARRSSSLDRTEATLQRAYSVQRDPFMRRMVEDWHVREIARRSGRAGLGEIIRVTQGGDMSQPGTLTGDWPVY